MDENHECQQSSKCFFCCTTKIITFTLQNRVVCDFRILFQNHCRHSEASTDQAGSCHAPLRLGSILSRMALLIFLTVAMAHGASEEFWEGKLAQLSQELATNANSLDQETRRVKKDADSDYTKWKSWDDWWDKSFHPKLQKQIELVNELEKKLHQYRHVSQEVQIAEIASFGPCWWCFGACVLVLVVVFFCGWRFGDEVLQGFIVPAVCSISGGVEWFRQWLEWFCQQDRKKAAAPNTEPFLGPNDKEQSARDAASHASGCSHSESGDSHSSWDKI